jgi:hypothetical protein
MHSTVNFEFPTKIRMRKGENRTAERRRDVISSTVSPGSRICRICSGTCSILFFVFESSCDSMSSWVGLDPDADVAMAPCVFWGGAVQRFCGFVYTKGPKDDRGHLSGFEPLRISNKFESWCGK